MDVFDRAWKVLEAKGQCDSMGGMEYTRLRDGWDRVLGVLVAIDFIQSGAHKPPSNPTTDEWGLPDIPPDLPPIPDLPLPEFKN